MREATWESDLLLFGVSLGYITQSSIVAFYLTPAGARSVLDCRLWSFCSPSTSLVIMSPGAEMELKDVASVKEDMASVRQVETTLMDATTNEDAIFLNGFSAKEHNRIFRKVDFHIVPMLMLLYLFANLDRSVTPFVPPWLFPSFYSLRASIMKKGLWPRVKQGYRK